MVVTILSIVQVIACLFLIVTILLQKAPSQGLSGAVSGQQETFFGSNKATGIEAILANLTKIFGVIFIVDSLILVLLGWDLTYDAKRMDMLHPLSVSLIPAVCR